MISKVKIIFSFILFLILIYLISIYFFLKNINEKKIIDNIEANQNIIITKNKDTVINIFPSIEIIANLNFKNLKNNITSKNLNIKYSQSLYFTNGKLVINTNDLRFNKFFFNEVIINSNFNFIKNYFFNNFDLDYLLNTKYNIKGSFNIETSNEEKFIISFLKLFFEKLENKQNDKFAFSKLIDTLRNGSSNFNGLITKNNNLININNILIKNNENEISLSGQYDLFSQDLKIDLNLSQKNVNYLIGKILGNIHSPKIIFDKESKFFSDFNKKDNDVIEESIKQFLNNFLNLDD